MTQYEKKDCMLEAYRQELTGADAAWMPPVYKIWRCIFEYLFDQKLTLGWAKEIVDVHDKNLSARFKLRTGFTPKAYIVHHRIEAGKQLLKKTELTVSAVALSVGFASLASFDNTFKNKTGLRPTTWRKRMQAEEN